MSDRPPNESWRDIRPVALGVVRRNDEVFVLEFHDETAEETFYRPPGGGIQFGETAAEAIERELREELAWDVHVEERLGIVENIFTFEGSRGHEYAFVFAVDPTDQSVYDRERLVGTESNGEEFHGCWKAVDSFRKDEAPPLYPDGLLTTLE